MNRISVCLLLALLCIVVAISATKTTPVDCDYIDAQDRKGYQHVFNLSVLQRQTSEHLLKVYDPKGPWTYEFSICNNFECGKWDTGVCQHGQNEDVPCSEEFSQRFNAAIYDHELQALTLLVPMTEGNGTIFRGSEITIVCDPHALYPTNISVRSPPAWHTSYMYDFTLYHYSVCEESQKRSIDRK